METKFTKEQLNAIETHDCNLLVAAAAGSGKTAVLVERIIRMITRRDQSFDIDRLLVVTFTNAAAAEMRERIGKAIESALEREPDNNELQKQLVLLNRASITTIHSFCLGIIRNNFHRLNLDPSFRVSDETENLLLKLEALEELLEKRYTQENITDDFLAFVESYSSDKDDKNIENIILELYQFSMSMPWPEEFLNNSCEAFKVSGDYNFDETMFGKYIVSEIKEFIPFFVKQYEKALSILEEDSLLKESYYENLINEYNTVKAFKDIHQSFSSYREGFLNVNFGTLKRLKKGADKERAEEIKKLRASVKDKINKLCEEYFYFSDEELREELLDLYPKMKILTELVLEFKELYSEKKKSRGIIDFNDIEHFALKLLCEVRKEKLIPTDVAISLKEKFEEVLIDEYQDSNLVQEVIMKMVSRSESEKPNLFMVGDIKQSIYRFRQAKPELFLEKYNSYEVDKGINIKILLFKNFRSRKEILNGINYIFKSIMSQKLGELEYSDIEALNPGVEFESYVGEDHLVGGPIELNIINKKPKSLPDEVQDECDEVIEEIDSITLEAKLVSQKIKTLIYGDKDTKAFKVYDKNLKYYRNVEYKDIVVLLRATSNTSDIFVEEFKNNRIPVYSDSNSGYFENVEVQLILSLLQIIDNPLQDIPFASVLRSPIGGFSAEELVDIRNVYKKGYFFDAFRHIENEIEVNMEQKLKEKCNKFLKKLREYREISIHKTLVELLWYLYRDSGYYNFVGALNNGEQRQGNLRMLLYRAKAYENTSYKGVFNFINFINKLKLSSGDMGSAKLLGESDNVVRIMSIHKSKGLEFPVVFLCRSDKQFNLRDLSSRILFHHQFGFGPQYVNFEKRYSYDTIFKQCIKNITKSETLSEEMRILYVALTRAKEKLIITGSVNDIEKSVEKYGEALKEDNLKLSKELLLKGKSYLDYICYSIIRHNDGTVFRDLININEGKIIGDDSKFLIKLINREEILKNVSTVENNENNEKINIKELLLRIEKEENSDIYNEIHRRLSYKYPYEYLSKIPSSVTVSEIKRKYYDDDNESSQIYIPKLNKKPRFLEEKKGLTASEKGTALHTVMQHIDLTKNISIEYVKNAMDKMVNDYIITEEERKYISPEKVVNFFNSALGKRLLSSKRVYREFPFLIRVDASEIHNEVETGNEKVIVQGIIDVFFEEEGEIVLIDYKSDYVNEADEIKNKYNVQIQYYKRALEMITKKKVKESFIYLFSSNDIIKF